MEIRPVGAELFYADGQTDTTKPIVAFSILRTRLKCTKLLSSPYVPVWLVCPRVRILEPSFHLSARSHIGEYPKAYMRFSCAYAVWFAKCLSERGMLMQSRVARQQPPSPPFCFRGWKKSCYYKRSVSMVAYRVQLFSERKYSHLLWSLQLVLAVVCAWQSRPSLFCDNQPTTEAVQVTYFPLSKVQYLQWPARDLVYLVSSDICITVFYKLFL